VCSSDLSDIQQMAKSDTIWRLLHMLRRLGVSNEHLQLALFIAISAAKVSPNGGEYSISEGLADQLYETEIRGLLCSDLHLPYEGVFIDCPQIPVRLTDARMEPLNLAGILIQEYERAWAITFDLRSRVDATRTMFSTDRLDLSVSDALLTNAVPNSYAKSIIEGVSQVKAFDRLVFFATNIILYMTWPDAEVDHIILDPHARKLWEKIERTPKCKRRDRLESLLATMDTKKTYMLGHSVIYVSRQQVMDADHAAGRNTGKKLLAYQKIPGFWRNQPYGPRNSLRRRQWIRPYVRGPEYGVLSEPIHKLVGGASP